MINKNWGLEDAKKIIKGDEIMLKNKTSKLLFSLFLKILQKYLKFLQIV